MSEATKKNLKKAKNDPKEQRKPRQRNQPTTTEKTVDRKPEPKVPVQSKPVYEEPGPEFYKGLKRETDEILKITEEANSKYKKKEIQSNWAKYEMPIESYEEIEEQENMGADYEKLIQAPLSLGGHFQFKHEKSWDLNTGPSLYDKYFDINMDNLAIALSTIPFYERNGIEKHLFSQTDIINMDNRSTKYKQKYYNDKSFITPELEAQDKLVSSSKENFQEDTNKKESNKLNIENNISLETHDIVLEKPAKFVEMRSDSEVRNHNSVSKEEDKKDVILVNTSKSVPAASLGTNAATAHDDLDDILLLDSPVDKVDRSLDDTVDLVAEIQESHPQHTSAIKQTKDDPKESSTPKSTKNPVMESPEDLEKWLDDFLEN